MGSAAATLEPLAAEEFVSLTTFRRSGQGVPTPVWLVVREGRVYVTTGAGSGKVKRIRNDARVTLAPCTRRGKVTGPSYEGRARIVQGPAAERAGADLRRKYGWQLRLIMLIERVARGGRSIERAIIEVEPAG